MDRLPKDPTAEGVRYRKSMVCRNSRLNRLVLLAFLLAAFATISTIMIEYYYLPLGVDGGWYSYPALSLSRGGDARENLLSVEELGKIGGIKSSFRAGGGFAQSIRIIPMSWWFIVFGKTIWAAKLFGILELLILMAIMFLILKQLGVERNVLLLCWALFFMDGVAIASGSTDLRADLMLTILTLSVLLFVWIEDMREHRLLIFLGGTLSILLLVLTRITSALPLFLLISYLLTDLCVSWRKISRFRKYFYFSLIVVGVIGFTLRNQLLDLLIANKISFHSTYFLERYAYGKISAPQILALFEKELDRWRSYFFMSNTGELIGILLGFCLFFLHTFFQSIFQSNKKSTAQVTSVVVSCIAGVGGLALFDPLNWAAHALPIVPFFIIFLAYQMKSISNYRIRSVSVSILIAIVVVSAGIKMAHGTKVMIMSKQNEYSNVAVSKAINHLFNSGTKSYVVVAGTELWPYFDPGKNVVIIDERTRKGIDRLSKVVGLVDFIIINNDYTACNWERQFAERYPNIQLRTVAGVGNPSSGWYFIKIIKPYSLE